MARIVTFPTGLTLVLGLAAGLAFAAPSVSWAQDQTPADPAMPMPEQGAAAEGEDINTLTNQGVNDEALPAGPDMAAPMVAGGCPIGSAYGEAEIRSRMTTEDFALFERWDLNADGSVSVAEQTECLAQVGQAPAAPAIVPGG